MGDSGTRKLQWEIEYLGPKGLKRLEPGEALALGGNVYYAVRGELPKDLPLVYVLQMDAKSRLVRIALAAMVEELGVKPGREARLPPAGNYLFNPTKGIIHVVAVARQLKPDQLAKLVGGREPPPDPVLPEPT